MKALFTPVVMSLSADGDIGLSTVSQQQPSDERKWPGSWHATIKVNKKLY